jgi:hypothetical protein
MPYREWRAATFEYAFAQRITNTVLALKSCHTEFYKSIGAALLFNQFECYEKFIFFYFVFTVLYPVFSANKIGRG